MVAELRRLSSEELDLVYKAPFLVSLLIAGADDEIDRKEIKEAIRFAEESIREVGSSMALLFAEIAQDFEDKLKVLIQHYPYESAQRNPLLVSELSRLNTLWKKMDKKFASEFYSILIKIAEHIAESSGGVLGIRSVGSEEARYIRLSMINNPATT